jgi:inhibitor of growth protein 4
LFHTSHEFNCIFSLDRNRKTKEKDKKKTTRDSSEDEAPVAKSRKKQKRGGSKTQVAKATETVATTPLAHPSEVLDMPVDPNEPTYCLCHQVSYGEMIACEYPDVSCVLLIIFLS